MDETTSEVAARRQTLRAELVDGVNDSDAKAHRFEQFSDKLFYGALCFGGLVVLLGFVPDISPKWASLAGAVATGCTVFLREAKFRLKANGYYAFRDTVDALRSRLDYEMPIPVTKDNVAAIAKELRIAREALGKRLSAINSSGGSDVKTASIPQDLSGK